ncbi:MAG: urease accessory protein UreD [Lachnospiraceae bacterium]|nr:urease accessory protein UreD [Lachnospiraceae bacterium]
MMENQFGKLSKLQITAAEKDGKTILENIYFTSPFKIMRPFYEKGDFMTVMLLTASAGIMAGDRQEFEIRVRENAKMEFVSQAYEKIHKMADGCAKRQTQITVEPNACLHYTPLPTIPFAGSDFRSCVDVELADETSRFVFSEVLTCGRAAHGEEFQYHRFSNRVSISQGGRIVYRDHTCYEPSQTDMRGFGMYEGFTHLANLVICNEQKGEIWMENVRELLDASEQMEGGVTRTAAGHMVVRILGRSGQKLTDAMEKILTLE